MVPNKQMEERQMEERRWANGTALDAPDPDVPIDLASCQSILGCMAVRDKCDHVSTRGFWAGIATVVSVIITLWVFSYSQKSTTDVGQDFKIIAEEKATAELKTDLSNRLDRIQTLLNALVELKLKEDGKVGTLK